MNSAKISILAAAWAASLLGVGVMAQGGRGANATEPPPAPTRELGQPVGPIITGENIGFQRLVAYPDREGKIVGVLKVKVDGEWFEVTAPVRLVRAK